MVREGIPKEVTVELNRDLIKKKKMGSVRKMLKKFKARWKV